MPARNETETVTLAWNIQRGYAHGSLVLEGGSASVHNADLVHIRPRLAVRIVRRQHPTRPRLHENLSDDQASSSPLSLSRTNLPEDNLGAVKRQLFKHRRQRAVKALQPMA